jgi:quercetin dioxygenase-like cupin family protein
LGHPIYNNPDSFQEEPDTDISPTCSSLNDFTLYLETIRPAQTSLPAPFFFIYLNFFMRFKPTSQIMLAICISLFVIACGQGDKKTDDSKTTDSVSTATTDSATTAAAVTLPDAVKAAPNLYKTLQDTLGIRILEADYKPGDSSAMHSHPDYALYVIAGGKTEFIAKDGNKMVSEMKSADENIRPAEVHSVKNVGKNEVKVLLVEVNRSMGSVSSDVSMDASKVAPNLYKVVKDTMGIRILHATYKPGQSSAMHSHPDLAMYVISGGTTEFTGKDGKKDKRELKTGMSMIVPAGAHSVKNIGNTTTKVLLVEVNRPAK